MLKTVTRPSLPSVAIPHWEGYGKDKRSVQQTSSDFVPRMKNIRDRESSSVPNRLRSSSPIKVLSKRNDIVLEPFGGSGSTLIACEKMHRHCRIMEKSPVYAEVIRKRWENNRTQSGKIDVKIWRSRTFRPTNERRLFRSARKCSARLCSPSFERTLS